MTAALMVSAAALQVPPDVIPPGAIDIAQSFFAMVAVIALGIPIIRVFSRRLERGRPNMSELPLDLTNRLERIEQSVEAEKTRGDALSRRFEEALRQAKEEPVTKPMRDFDLD